MTRTVLIALVVGTACIQQAQAADRPNPRLVALELDKIVDDQLQANDVKPALRSTDEDFLRRVTLDITGTVPTITDITKFGLNRNRTKRSEYIDELLASDGYAETWARYWRDVIFIRATNARSQFANASFLRWMTESLDQNKSWDKITAEMLTATGDVRENGATALIFAQEAGTEDITGEVSRIFLGIQMQCANCHDHPWDRWKREEFHELAAFFPRIGIRPIREDNRLVTYEVVSVDRPDGRQQLRDKLMENLPRLFRAFDRNRDGKLSSKEVNIRKNNFSRVFDRLVQVADKNKDGQLTMTEIKEAPQPQQNQPGRGATEHFMPDLNNPQSPGTKMEPKFFLTSTSARQGMNDSDRREAFVRYLTSTKNEWFSKAIVNRMWGQLIGEGFYSPIDDMGPDREPSYPKALEYLAQSFVDSGYDLKWLMKTITLTQIYQREIRTTDPNQQLAFASATPTRLRGDQIYNSILTVLSGRQPSSRTPLRSGYQGDSMRRRSRDPRDAFSVLFGYDPSTPQSDVTGNVPQALFMMNSPQITKQTQARFGTRLSLTLRRYRDDEQAVRQLYLMVFARKPTADEIKICKDYVSEVGNRNEAFEDILWSMLNSTEFITKR